MIDERDAGPPPAEEEGASGLTPEEWRLRRERLERRLDESRARRAEAAPKERSAGMRGMAEGFRIASEFIAGVVVGAVIGYGIDRLFDTAPFGLILFLLLGFAAGVLNVVRSAAKSGQPPTGPEDRAGPPAE